MQPLPDFELRRASTAEQAAGGSWIDQNEWRTPNSTPLALPLGVAPNKPAAG